VAYLVGAILALAVGGLSSVVGLDRDRAFYPTVLIVVASYYALFAVVGESTHALVIEAVVATGWWSPPWPRMASSTCFMIRSSPIQVFRRGGRHSASRTTVWRPGISHSSCTGTWFGCVQPDAA
jgi:hypothetical protein